MYRPDFFDRDWLNYKPLFTEIENVKLNINLSLDFFQQLRLDNDSILQYRINAVNKLCESLGDNPALCISGGVDSQAMLHSFLVAKRKFTAYIFVFENDLNLFDVNIARQYCKLHHVSLIEIPFNILSFLTMKNYDIGIQFQSSSPHFNAHYEFCNLLKSKGHTGVCFGGLTPFRSRSAWGVNFVRNVFNYITYSNITQFYVQGSFLSYYPELAWAIAILTPMTDCDISRAPADGSFRTRSYAVRYANKVLGYHKAKFDIMESQKYSGFEKVKEYFAEKTNDGWEFEKRFRMPLDSYLNRREQFVQFEFLPEVENYLNSLCCKN